MNRCRLCNKPVKWADRPCAVCRSAQRWGSASIGNPEKPYQAPAQYANATKHGLPTAQQFLAWVEKNLRSEWIDTSCLCQALGKNKSTLATWRKRKRAPLVSAKYNEFYTRGHVYSVHEVALWIGDRQREHVEALQRAHEIHAARPNIPRSWRRRIYAKHGKRCLNCGATDNIQIDHVVPLSRGGAHDPTNMQPLCGPCNQNKGAKLMSEWKRRPRRQCTS